MAQSTALNTPDRSGKSARSSYDRRHGYAAAQRPDRSAPPAFEPAPRIEVARPLPSRNPAACHPVPRTRIFSASELGTIAILIAIISAIAIVTIMMAAESAETQSDINALKRDIAQAEDDITQIKIEINQSQNIEMIRSRAEAELGMKAPEYDQYIYVSDLPGATPEFAAYIKEKVYGARTAAAEQ